MHETAARGRCAARPSRELWKSIPLEVLMSAFAIIVAAGLKLAGVMP